MSSNDKNYQRLIQDKRWARLRRWKLSACPICESCQERGILTVASEVHHRMPVEEALSVQEMELLMYQPSNLESLCHACHVQRHKDMKQHSRKAQKDLAQRRLQRFKEKFLD